MKWIRRMPEGWKYNPNEPISIINHVFAIVHLLKEKGVNYYEYAEKYNAHPMVTAIIFACGTAMERKGRNGIAEARSGTDSSHLYQAWIRKTDTTGTGAIYHLEEVQDLTECVTLDPNEILEIVQAEYKLLLSRLESL